jgi:hypothetical protein
VTVGFGSSPSTARIDISVRYFREGEADYLREGAIRREDGQAFLDISRSRTDMVLLFIGVSFGRHFQPSILRILGEVASEATSLQPGRRPWCSRVPLAGWK